jgi:hypothetical protein
MSRNISPCTSLRSACLGCGKVRRVGMVDPGGVVCGVARPMMAGGGFGGTVGVGVAQWS